MQSQCNSRDLEISQQNHGNNFPQKAIRNINPWEQEKLGMMATEKMNMNLYQIPKGTNHGRDCSSRKQNPYLHDMYQDRSHGTYNMVAEKISNKFQKGQEQTRTPGFSAERNIVSFDGNNGVHIGSGGIGLRKHVDSPGRITDRVAQNE